MLNSENVSYTGNVFIGTPLQGNSNTKFIFDSGSGYLDVMSDSCKSCKTAFYNSTASSTYSNSTNPTTSISYGSGSVEGYMGVDNVCLSDSISYTCAQQFNFFLVTNQTGLNQQDGILGLGPPFSDNGPSFF